MCPHPIHKINYNRVFRSNSPIRASVALSALIRLCPTDYGIEEFFHNAHERIGHLDSAVFPIEGQNIEKKCYLFLIALSWAHPGLWILNPTYKIFSETSERMTLLNLVKSWR